MERLMRQLLRNQSGQSALAMILILLVLGGLIMGPLLGLMGTGLKAGQTHEELTLGLYAADSGVEDTIHWLANGRRAEGAWDGWDEDTGYGERDPYHLNDRDVDVTVERMDEIGFDYYKVTSVATSPDGSTIALSTIWAISFFEDGHEFKGGTYGDVYVNGDCSIATTANMTGNVVAEGDVQIQNKGQVGGDVYSGGNLTLGNQAKITGDVVCVGGDITLGQQALVEADLHLLDGPNTIRLGQKHAEILGNILADGNLTINIRVHAGIGGESNTYNIYANGDIYIDLGNKFSYVRVDDIYATGDIDENPENIGTFHYLDKFEEYGDPAPFTVPECPEPGFSSPRIISWEIA